MIAIPDAVRSRAAHRLQLALTEYGVFPDFMSQVQALTRFGFAKELGEALLSGISGWSLDQMVKLSEELKQPLEFWVRDDTQPLHPSHCVFVSGVAGGMIPWAPPPGLGKALHPRHGEFRFFIVEAPSLLGRQTTGTVLVYQAATPRAKVKTEIGTAFAISDPNGLLQPFLLIDKDGVHDIFSPLFGHSSSPLSIECDAVEVGYTVHGPIIGVMQVAQ